MSLVVEDLYLKRWAFQDQSIPFGNIVKDVYNNAVIDNIPEYSECVDGFSELAEVIKQFVELKATVPHDKLRADMIPIWEKYKNLVGGKLCQSQSCYDYVSIKLNDGTNAVGHAFMVEQFTDLFSLDLFHLLVSWNAQTPRICPRCGQLFLENNAMGKYCRDCKNESGAIYSEMRRKSVRYFHKKIYDKINQSRKYDEDFLSAFVLESNFYWDSIRGKATETNPTYTEQIKTESDYKAWLERKLKEL
jgi:hypothetical protein